MSESTEDHTTAIKLSYENKYKRALSLNDSWNLGQELTEMKPGKQIRLRKYESLNEDQQTFTIKISCNFSQQQIEETESIPESEVDGKCMECEGKGKNTNSC